jgi:sarcosine oxidase subunit gamma
MPDIPQPPLAIRRTALTEAAPIIGAGLRIEVLPPMQRWMVHGAPAAARGFGVPLPRQVCRANTEGARAALWLGPEEFLLIAPQSDPVALPEADDDADGMLLDVGHRQVALAISGAAAEIVLNAACPLDLNVSAFPVGMCTRTVLGKCGIVLWRTGADRFHLDVARSFAAYAHALLSEAAQELL